MPGVRRNCRLCPAPIALVRTEDGKTIPLDLRAQVYELAHDLVGDEVAKPAERFYVSHEFTCPKANEFSRSKKGRGP